MDSRQEYVEMLLSDVKKNFTSLINYLMHYDGNSDDVFSWEIINELERLPSELEISLLLNDLVQRNFCVPSKVMYEGLWYSIVSNESNRGELVNQLLQHKHWKDLLSYIKSLNKGKGRSNDANILKVVNDINYMKGVVKE